MVLFVCFLFYFKTIFLFYILSTDPLNGWATHSTCHFQGSFWVGWSFSYFWVWPGSLVLVQGLPNPTLANVPPAPQLDGIPHTP